ncbi:MAG: hypothetical protein KKF54_05260, partial [Candidatus Omnitrophica bacterium]|nr:hypothetical protein [Candidatus Omnitrophota bacterium]
MKTRLCLIVFIICFFIVGLFNARAGTLEFDGVPVDITTSDNEDLVVVPGTGGNTQIGDGTGANSYATTNDDLHVTGVLEADEAVYFDSTAEVTGSITASGGVVTNIISTTTGALSLNPASGFGVTGVVSMTASTGNEAAYDLSATINKSTSGNYTGLKLNVTETSAPGSSNKLMDLQVGSSTKFGVLSDGSVKIIDGNQTNGYVLTSDVNGVGTWQAAAGGAGGGANTALSNLSSVAINLGLTPGAADSINLGSSTYEWNALYLGDDAGVYFGQDQNAHLYYDETTDDRLELVG